MAASRRSIIAATKHIPGGARPTPGPQGAGNFGHMSPLSAQLDTGGPQGDSWTRAYGGFLPRPASVFTQGAFGPFSPILPVPIDEPPSSQTPRAEPRREQYQVGWNLPVGEPGSEGIKLASFGTLKTLADLYSVARSCIQLRKNEIVGLSWDITPTRDAAKAMRGSHSQMKDFGERRAEAIKFFRRPDPDYFSWGTWLSALLEQVFVFDALALLLRPKWGKGMGKGLLGSDLDSLNLISGPTIRPLYAIDGSYPRPPDPAYQQYLYGVPRSDLTTMVTGRDIDEAGLKGYEWAQYRGDQLLYLTMVPRRETPYGFPPIERALVPVMSGLQKQAYQLDFYREGTVPAVYVSPGGVNANMTPNQIRELQDALNAIAGDPAWKHKIIVLPADSRVEPQRSPQLADQFDEIVMNQVCMAFDVMPMELGIMPKVSATVSPGAGNQMAKATAGIHERKATKPTLQFLADIFDSILRDVCGQDDMKFTFEGLEEDEDEATQTDLISKQIGFGLASIDEGREALGRQPWGLPETSDPGWATATGFVPLGQITPTGDVAAGPQPTATAPAGQQAAAKPTGQPAPGQTSQPGGKQPPKAAPKPTSGKPSTPGHAAAQSASSAAKTATTIHPHQARRDQHLNTIHQTVVDQLHHIADAYNTNQLTFPDAVDTAVAALANGYRHAMNGAAQHARTDHAPKARKTADLALLDNSDTLDDDSDWNDDWDDSGLDADAQTHAENQRPYLTGLIKDLAAGTIASIGTRLGLYGATLKGAYNAAYNRIMGRTQPHAVITWRLGNTEHCPKCMARDGQTFTQDSLPGLPGTGGFGGQICDGGPRCGCWLQYQQPDTTKQRAVDAELEALGRHLRKGRRISTWEPRHITQHMLARISEHIAKGLDPVDAIHMVKAMRRRVGLNGQQYWQDVSRPDLIPMYPVAQGGGGRVFPAHDVDGIEVPGGTPGISAGGEPPRWTPRPAAGAGNTLTGPRPRTMQAPDDADDADWPDQPRSVPPRNDRWPGGGIGTSQADTSTPPGRLRKNADDLHDPTPVEAVHVENLMRDNFPPKALTWVADAQWIGPVKVPLDRIDWDDEDTWAASHQGKHVNEFAKRIKAGDGPHPAIGVQTAGADQRIKLVDGHHRALAYKKLGRPVVAYIGTVPAGDTRWQETHSYQLHQGSDPANKAAKVSKASVNYRPATSGTRCCGTCSMFRAPDSCTLVAGSIRPADVCDEWDPKTATKGNSPLPVAAGIAIQAADTGRVLMLQRAITDTDPAAGMWEFPGGCLEAGETPVIAATREWSEETGCTLPPGGITGGWDASNGRYQGFVYCIESEADLPISDGRDQVTNPDDPDGDLFEAVAWWDPAHLADNPAVRTELLTDLDRLLDALGVDDAVKAATLHKAAGSRGNPAALIRWYNQGAGGAIQWGGEGDLTACHAVASRYMDSDQAWGFCQERARDAMGHFNKPDRGGK